MHMNMKRKLFLLTTLLSVLFIAGGCSNSHDEQIPKEVREDVMNIWGTSDADLFAVGQAGLILHYDGKTWSRMESGTSQVLHDIAGVSPQDVFVVGLNGTLLHYDRQAWKPVEFKIESSLYGIWVASASDVFAVGDNGTILHYDGKLWRQMSSGTNDGLLDVWGSDGSDVYAVGVGGTILHYDGKSWSRVALPIKVRLRSVSGVSKARVYAVGDEGTIVQFDGQNWKVVMQKDAKSHWNGVCAFPDGEVRVVGWDSKTAGIMMYYDGRSWGDCRTSLSVGNWSEIESVWGFSSKNFFCVGLDGISHRFR
jgi:photosystem II stability/assembly factor-like uncharacterized protein